MKNGIQKSGVWLCILFTLVLGGCNQEGKEEIRQAHAQWEQAFLDRDGERHYELFALPAQEYYSRILSYARNASRRQIEQSPLVEQGQILIARQMFTAKQLAELDGKSFVVKSIVEGWYDPDDSWTETIRDIKFNGENYASAEMVADGVPQEARYGFIREAGVWKIDDTMLDEVYNRDIELEAAYYEQTVKQYIIEWVEDISGETMPDSLWDAPKK